MHREIPYPQSEELSIIKKQRSEKQERIGKNDKNKGNRKKMVSEVDKQKRLAKIEKNRKNRKEQIKQKRENICRTM